MAHGMLNVPVPAGDSAGAGARQMRDGPGRDTQRCAEETMASSLMPTPVLASLRKEMDRLFERAWDSDFDLPTLGEWTPVLDLSEADDAISVRMEIPGIEPKDIHVTLKDQVLTIRGEKKREVERKDERFYRLERNYGSFVRTLTLPTSVREDKVNATFKNGVLTIQLMKVPEQAGTTIPVKAG